MPMLGLAEANDAVGGDMDGAAAVDGDGDGGVACGTTDAVLPVGII